jgi:hypothetical protein
VDGKGIAARETDHEPRNKDDGFVRVYMAGLGESYEPWNYSCPKLPKDQEPFGPQSLCESGTFTPLNVLIRGRRTSIHPSRLKIVDFLCVLGLQDSKIRACRLVISSRALPPSEPTVQAVSQPRHPLKSGQYL